MKFLSTVFLFFLVISCANEVDERSEVKHSESNESSDAESIADDSRGQTLLTAGEGKTCKVNEGCADGLLCKANTPGDRSANAKGKCVKDGQENQPCIAGQYFPGQSGGVCTLGLQCNDQKICVRPEKGTVGKECKSDGICDFGLKCNDNNICEELAGEGASCEGPTSLDKADTCPAPFVCSNISSGKGKCKLGPTWNIVNDSLDSCSLGDSTIFIPLRESYEGITDSNPEIFQALLTLLKNQAEQVTIQDFVSLCEKMPKNNPDHYECKGENLTTLATMYVAEPESSNYIINYGVNSDYYDNIPPIGSTIYVDGQGRYMPRFGADYVVDGVTPQITFGGKVLESVRSSLFGGLNLSVWPVLINSGHGVARGPFNKNKPNPKPLPPGWEQTGMDSYNSAFKVKDFKYDSLTVDITKLSVTPKSPFLNPTSPVKCPTNAKPNDLLAGFMSEKDYMRSGSPRGVGLKLADSPTIRRLFSAGLEWDGESFDEKTNIRIETRVIGGGSVTFSGESPSSSKDVECKEVAGETNPSCTAYLFPIPKGKYLAGVLQNGFRPDKIFISAKADVPGSTIEWTSGCYDSYAGQNDAICEVKKSNGDQTVTVKFTTVKKKVKLTLLKPKVGSLRATGPDNVEKRCNADGTGNACNVPLSYDEGSTIHIVASQKVNLSTFVKFIKKDASGTTAITDNISSFQIKSDTTLSVLHETKVTAKVSPVEAAPIFIASVNSPTTKCADSCDLTVSSEKTATVSIPGVGTADYNPNYKFEYFTLQADANSTASTKVYSNTQEINDNNPPAIITAVFSPIPKVNLSVSTTGPVRLSVVSTTPPTSTSCGSIQNTSLTTCPAIILPMNTMVTISVADKPAGAQVTWGGVCTGSGNSCTRTLTQNNTAVSATVVPNKLTVTPPSSGSIQGSGINCYLAAGVKSGVCDVNASQGTPISLSYVPISGARPNRVVWNAGNTLAVAEGATYSFTMPSGNLSVNTSLTPLYKVTTTVTGNGTVISSSPGFDDNGGTCATNCQWFAANSTVVLAATPAEVGAVVTSGYCSFTMATPTAPATCNLNVNAADIVANVNFVAPAMVDLVLNKGNGPWGSVSVFGANGTTLATCDDSCGSLTTKIVKGSTVFIKPSDNTSAESTGLGYFANGGIPGGTQFSSLGGYVTPSSNVTGQLNYGYKVTVKRSLPLVGSISGLPSPMITPCDASCSYVLKYGSVNLNSSGNLVFTKWNSTILSDLTSYTVSGPGTLETRVLPTYTLTVTPNGGTGSELFTFVSDGVSKTGRSFTYTEGKSVTVTPVVNMNTTFTGWATPTSFPIIMNANRTLTANFVYKTYDISGSVNGVAGSVSFSSSASSVTCTAAPVSGTVCKAYRTNDRVTLTAPSAPTGWIFNGWSGACTGTSTECIVTVSANAHATANFSKIGDSICNTVVENAVGGNSISCPAGKHIVIEYASYGTPDANCASISSCHAAGSLGIVQDRCNGVQACSVPADNATFGDPCYMVVKSLAIQYRCQ